MLLSTFQHLKGIGEKTEHKLWCSGVMTWDDLESKQGIQLSIFESNDDSFNTTTLQNSRKAFEEENAEFFAKRLPNSEQYRVALSFPYKTIFLDIETTGLSRYYDSITIVGWSMGTKYNVYIQGDDDSSLRSTLKQAKAIVTFNGSLFDLPFLRKEFNNIQIPIAHIDLRFMSRRVGLLGGQKNIEKILGFKRAANLLSLKGEAAPLLWYKYLRGDIDSLKSLISYNHADVEGMKYIFDSVITRLLEKQKVPTTISSVHSFASHPSKLRWTSDKSQATENVIYLPTHQGRIRTNISLKDIACTTNLSHIRVVGIDLCGSETRPSGWSLLEGDHALTQRLKSDADIIAATIDVKPTLVSIDSPLSLPKGRISVDDADPGRKVFGITRSCERILKKRGISVYPSLIQSMQTLTARGIRLATYFRSQGIPVIESYPGAAQDIMNIPRKRASLELLKSGLVELGIRGEFCNQPISHDELDAITSSIVGLFFWSGKFEALGNSQEEYLIIPDIDNTQSNWINRRVIGLSGSIASGKTTAGEFLKSSGFHYARYSLVLADILKERSLKSSRETLQQVGEEINKNLGQRWLCQKLFEKLPNQGNIVIDGLRYPEDHAFWVEKFGSSFMHIHITCPQEIRVERYVSRGGSYEEFISADSHLVEADVIKLASLADVSIANINSPESFISMLAQAVEYKGNTKNL
ncbi:ribonuclease H-like domain-containing protein [Microcoleus sp. ZQ-A2]|nr:ribonuclease H-like domain-containing protein [Microcoleus sp. FACHB-1]